VVTVVANSKLVFKNPKILVNLKILGSCDFFVVGNPEKVVTVLTLITNKMKVKLIYFN
jgi:hypothetical protein